MFKEKDIQIYKDQKSLHITLKWYTPVAFFLLFFSIAWNAFLVAWYTIAFGANTPLIAKIFPIVHVAVGLWLIYYTACLFLNKTHINIEDNWLNINHEPIPWWRGNQQIATEDIEQLYVKQKTSKSKNGTQYTYSLRAKMKDKSDKGVIVIDNIPSHRLEEIERHLEEFIGIEDAPVKGEYAFKNAQLKAPQARKQRREASRSAFNPIYVSEEEDLLAFQGEELEITSVAQYDWTDGNSDKNFQALNPKDEEVILYLVQNQALLEAYQEKKLSLFETNDLSFEVENPPNSIVYQGVEYFLNQHKTGEKFVSGVSGAIIVAQWLYLSKDQKKCFRVINNQGFLAYRKGQQLKISDFQNTLDLNNPPQKEIREIPKNWTDEDFV